MGADAPMLRSRRRGTRICHHPWCGAEDDERPMRERHDEVLAVGRDMIAQWSDALDLMAGICPACHHPFEAVRPDGGDGIYRWCGITGCRCAHHDREGRAT